MKRPKLSELATISLIAAYRKSAERHGEATEAGDYVTANREAGDLAVIYAELRLRGLESQQCLLPLLCDPEDRVRLWAAAHALEFAPSIGEQVLAKLAETTIGFVKMDANMTLKEWREGRLRFPGTTQ